MKYDINVEREKLDEINEKFVEYMKNYPKKSISLTAIGNSISDGFSFSEPDRPLLDRNLELIELAKRNGLVIKKNQLSRSENNNSLAVASWIRNGCTEQDCYDWNKEDYRRNAREGKTLLSDEEIEKYFSNGNKESIEDVILNPLEDANIVIINLGTGSLLDVLVRSGKITFSNISNSVQRDLRGISEILELIQDNNRQNNSHTQVYLCGAPRVMDTQITDLVMNNAMKRLGKEYANVTFVPSFPRKALYRTVYGTILPDTHYDKAEYYHLLSNIEKSIIDNYLGRELLIELDRILYKLSLDNDLNDEKYTTEKAVFEIQKMAKQYKEKGGDVNTFLNLTKEYMKYRYPFDFYRLSPNEKLDKSVGSLQKKLIKK